MNSLNRDLKQLVDLVESQQSDLVNKDPARLSFHIMPPVGWLNDPNGLCYFKGEYHVFFQYSPFNCNGGLKLWGHYKSPDLINWTYLGVPLLSDEAFDCHGVYSGSAFVEDDIMYLFYTGNVKYRGDYDYITDGRESNTIMVSSMDGISFTNKQLIMQHKDYPNHLTCHVRDPKVFKLGQAYYMVQGARTMSDTGEVIVLESKDKIIWENVNVLKSDQSFGYMWECPDLFFMEGQTILSVSPQGVDTQGINYENIYQSGYYFLKGDFRSDYTLSEFKEYDRGFDFYAPQTFEDENNRRILIGWMGLPDIDDLYYNPTVKYGWQHALTIPRELKIENGKLLQAPVKELESLRIGELKKEFESKLEFEDRDTFELIVDIEQMEGEVCLVIKDDIIFSYNQCTKIFTLEFKGEIGCGRTKRSVSVDSLKQIWLLCDTSSLEVFINGGEEVFTTRYYKKGKSSPICISGLNLNGSAIFYELKK